MSWFFNTSFYTVATSILIDLLVRQPQVTANLIEGEQLVIFFRENFFDHRDHFARIAYAFSCHVGNVLGIDSNALIFFHFQNALPELLHGSYLTVEVTSYPLAKSF
jgi:hypothetical protein